MVCAPVVGLRVQSCSRCPWQPQRLSPLGHRSVERALVFAPSSRFPLSPVLKNKMILAGFGTVVKNKISRAGRVQRVSAPLVDARSPSCIIVESCHLTARFPLCKPRPCRRFARSGACLRAVVSIVHCCTATAAYKRNANRRCLCLTPHLLLNSTTTPRPYGHT